MAYPLTTPSKKRILVADDDPGMRLALAIRPCVRTTTR